VLEAPELLADARYSSFATRLQHRDTLITNLKARFLTRTTAAWLTLLRGKVPCAPVNSVEQALADEQVLARDMIMEVDHPEFGLLRQVRTAIKVPDAVEHKQPGPALGADTATILQELLHYSDAEIANLQQKGVI
jgi:crotonobetainyl-CoA:carnitine CoA-transferase CaiB-like acyl-CoA transferase